MDKKPSTVDLFLKLSGYDKEKGGKSRIVNVEEFTDDYISLILGNGGGWCRTANVQNYKFARIFNENKINYSNCSQEEIKEIEKYVKNQNLKFTKENKIQYIMIWDNNYDKNNGRPISEEIKKYYKDKPCVVCGSTSELVVDHKNDLYNDPNVLNTKTQKKDDFQSLCNHCNLLKRGINSETKKTKKRYPATKIPSLKPFGIDFISGDENYDENDPNWGIGTYWYDPVKFMEGVKEINSKKETKNTNEDKEIDEISKINDGIC